MYVSGYIESWGENSAQQFKETFDGLAEKHSSIEVVFLNCRGGDVFEGMPSYNLIKSSKVPVTTIVSGYAASMGAFLFLAAKDRKMMPYSRLMLHSASGSVSGKSEDMRQMADQLESINSDLVKLTAESTGMSEDDVRAKYFDGADHWLSAADAVAAGLATGMSEGGLLKSDPAAKLEGSAIYAAYDEHIEAALPTDNQPTIMKKVAFIAALAAANKSLSLTAEASEDAILAEVTAQANALVAANARVAELEAAEKTAQEARAAELVDNAITANKIDKGQREQFLSLAKVDYANTSAVLAKMSAHTPIHATLNRHGKPAGEEFRGKSFKEISAAKGGEQYLASLRKTDADLFNRMKAAYSEVVE